MQKRLLALAMHSVVPERLSDRPVDGHDISRRHRGLARNLPILEAIIQEAAVEDLGVFDKGLLLQSLREAALGVVPGPSLEKLDIALSWLRWHSLQVDWQGPVMPADVRIIRQGDECSVSAGCFDTVASVCAASAPYSHAAESACR